MSTASPSDIRRPHFDSLALWQHAAFAARDAGLPRDGLGSTFSMRAAHAAQVMPVMRKATVLGGRAGSVHRPQL
jgi:hypothetical protein